MIVLITDDKRASGKTTLANEFLKDKKFIQCSSMEWAFNRFFPFTTQDFDWIFIDGATQLDIDVAVSLQKEEYITFGVRLESEEIHLKTPNFLLITNNPNLLRKTRSNKRK